MEEKEWIGRAWRTLGLGFLLLLGLPRLSAGQTQPEAGVETRKYSIEVAGIRVGTMTATRQPISGDKVRFTLTSDVSINLLVHKVIIYYHVVNQYQGGKLLSSVVNARTNRGNFASQTEWTGDQYRIKARQYKYEHEAVETAPITFSVTDLYFTEPKGQRRVYGEYFGTFFSMSGGAGGRYQARLNGNGQEDEYRYRNGQLVEVIKKNKVKNYVIRLQEP